MSRYIGGNIGWRAVAVSGGTITSGYYQISQANESHAMLVGKQLFQLASENRNDDNDDDDEQQNARGGGN